MPAPRAVAAAGAKADARGTVREGVVAAQGAHPAPFAPLGARRVVGEVRRVPVGVDGAAGVAPHQGDAPLAATKE